MQEASRLPPWIPLAGERLRLVGGGVQAERVEDLLEAVVQATSGGPSGGHVVLGPFGCGKTTLLRTLAGRLGPRCRIASLPVLARGAEDPAAVVDRWMGPGGSPDVLLLDGLDEVCRQPGDPLVREVFQAAARRGGRRWVLAGRTEVFRTEGGPRAPDQVDTLSAPDVTTWRVAPLSTGVVERYLGSLAEPLVQALQGVDLEASPVLLEVALRAGPGDMTPAALFGRALAQAEPGALDCLEALAWRAYAGVDAAGRLGSLDPSWTAGLSPALAATVLARDADGQPRFRHRSFFDYLVARRLAPLIVASQDGARNEATGRTLSEAMRVFLCGLVPPPAWTLDEDWVRVPAGNFVAGGGQAGDERPLRVGWLDRPVWLRRTPVSDGEFHGFLDATGGLGPQGPRTPGLPAFHDLLRHWVGGRPPADGAWPVQHLRPGDAEAFARWAGGTLPTADAWEKGARGLGGWRYPWGDAFDPRRANTAERGLGHPLPARALGEQGPTGLFAACGDVFEYTATAWRDLPDRGRVVMGGSFAHTGALARCGLRPSHRLAGALRAGFRLARDAD